MADVGDIIDYIKSLRKGFDKDEFSDKIEELAEIVDSNGLDYEEFHNLLRVWLNMSLPVTKWLSIGMCLVPRDRLEPRSVDYAMRWLLANFQNQTSYTRIGFVLDWLTAAMEADAIDLKHLDVYYEIFYMLVTYEVLTPHAIKLVYTLTKPMDITRRRVLELLDVAKKREAIRSKCRQIQALLGLFKSYKPECVPESIPVFSVPSTFKQPNIRLKQRFGRYQALRNTLNEEKQRLHWVNPMNMKGNKKVQPLIPNMEFSNVGSKQYDSKMSQKNYFDFVEPSALIEYSLRHELSRPARLLALLCNDAGLAMLATAPDSEHAFLSHDLHHLLKNCFLHTSTHSYAEKRLLLSRLATLQRTLMQGVPVVTRFLAQYLPLWNEKDYFHEILSLVEWISADSASHAAHILRPLGRVFHRSQPLQQAAVLTALTNLHENLVSRWISRWTDLLQLGESLDMSLDWFRNEMSNVYSNLILSLVEWVVADSASHAAHILRPLGRVFHRSQPLQQAAVLTALTNLHENLTYSNSRPRQYFLSMESSKHGAALAASLAEFIADLAGKALQVNPEDIRAQHTAIWCVERVARAQLLNPSEPTPPPPLVFALPLLGVSAAAIDKLACIMLLNKKIYGKIKKQSNATSRKMEDHLWTLQAYTIDLMNALLSETVLSERQSGVIFSKLHPQLVERISKTVPNADGALSLRSHAAFAPYTYSQFEALDYKETDNKLWFDSVIEPEFKHLSVFLKKIATELR
ncbi:unnamed protein product [Plutella xylostella]|uniref:(diamondback moth) hypothetical protein n=1 Tax=Plutella xylostella TaxID=51655 RepID=A0A8S4DG40_PLUXY|nr:unnamed protein product [Plutella xylostella]